MLNLNSTEFSHLTATQAQSLTSGADSVLHYHSSDRDRANHTGTQTSSTISDFSTAVAALIPASVDFMEVEGLQRLPTAASIPDLPYIPSLTEIENMQRPFALSDLLAYRAQIEEMIATSTSNIIAAEEFCGFARP